MATDKQQLAPQELRVVLLGGKHSGKTSLINTLLGAAVSQPVKQRLAHSLYKEGVVAGRKVALVDTNGWWRNFQLIDTAKFIQQELVLSVCLCPPGPHAFILTVMIDIPFNEENRRAVEEHMGLFGENIWGHTIIVFTRGESLQGRSIEQHIESEGEALKWVVEKCGNRYCVFEKKATDQKQVCELLGKVETTLQGNNGRHFELDKNVLKMAIEKKEDVKQRAKTRHSKMLKHRKELRETAQTVPLSEIRILLLGWVSSRKTSAKNIILNQTELVTKKTTLVQTHSGEVAGVNVSVVDTPGWWKYFPAESTPGFVRRELRKSLTLGSKAPHAVLIAIPADTTFPEAQRKVTEDNMKMMFGEMAWRHTVVLFTCGDLLGDTSIEEHIESEGEPLQWLIEKCGNRYHVFDNINRGDGSQVTELLEKIREIQHTSLAFETENTEVKEATMLGMEMGQLLDREWNRMDQKMEERLKKMWITAGPTIKGSLDAVVDFKGDGPSQKTEGMDDTLSLAFGQAQHQLKGHASEVHSELLEKMRDSLQREFGRRETVVMERAWGMWLEMSTSHDMTSEPGEHEREQSRQKVMQWDTVHTSGLGSELEDEEDIRPCQ